MGCFGKARAEDKVIGREERLTTLVDREDSKSGRKAISIHSHRKRQK
jgi:hypothetical protein